MTMSSVFAWQRCRTRQSRKALLRRTSLFKLSHPETRICWTEFHRIWWNVPHDAPHPSRKSDCNTLLGKPAFRQHTHGFKSVSYQGSSTLHTICFFTYFSPESPILPSIEMTTSEILPHFYTRCLWMENLGRKIRFYAAGCPQGPFGLVESHCFSTQDHVPKPVTALYKSSKASDCVRVYISNKRVGDNILRGFIDVAVIRNDFVQVLGLFSCC